MKKSKKLVGWNNSFECSGLNAPVFEDDPGGYFDWAAGCMTFEEPSFDPVPPVDPPPPPPCTPGTFTDSKGRCIRITCTPAGPLIEPCVKTNSDDAGVFIGGFTITSAGVRVKVVTQTGTRESLIKSTRLPLQSLASAMLNRSPLPVSAITKVPKAFWSSLPTLPPAINRPK